MEHATDCPLAVVLAERIRAARDLLTARWLERIAARVELEPKRIFPTEDLLDHVPLLLHGIADYMEDPAQVVGADAAVIGKARELGALRHAQGFDEYEILKEYEIFGGIVLSFLTEIVDGIDEPCSRSELLSCIQRVFHAVSLIEQATATQHLQLLKERLAEREERLRSFTRALTHEFRNRIGAARGAGQLLEMEELSAAERRKMAGVVVRSTEEMQMVLDGLLELSREQSDARQQRHVRLPQAAGEAARQLRDMAQGRGVTIRIAPDLPDVEVSAAAVELCLVNLLSNAIKYADPAQPERWVEVLGHVDEDAGRTPREVVVKVRDNGVGVPEGDRTKVFDRFFRARNERAAAVDGTGLGLSIVRETVEQLGGRVWAEFPGTGSVFAFSLPCRRSADRDGSTE